MKVLRLVLKQIKGVRQLDIVAHPTVNEISGPNGAGKSTALDAIVWAFSGKRAIDAKPLRDGAGRGEIIVETEQLTIERTFRENGDTRLTVKTKDGTKAGQRELDGLFGALTFDPLAFSRLPAAEQLTTLQRLAGEEFVERLASLDAEIEETTAARREAKRDLDRIGQIPAVEEVEEVDLSALSAEMGAIERFNETQRQVAGEVRRLEEARSQCESEIRRLEQSLTGERARLTALEQSLVTCQRPEKFKAADEVHAKLINAGLTNRKAAEYRAYLVRVEERQLQAAELLRLEEAVKGKREAREQLQQEARLPLADVTFDERGLRVRGIPFEQLSSSERIRVSCRIAMAMNPELRVMLIKDGSLLDNDAFAEVCRLAEDLGYQLWVETVGSGHGDAIVLERGEVATVPLSAVESL
jgi:energy-coupling factor transporter ATP-binding protein EcfA2